MVTFGGFKRRLASFRVAGVELCDIPTCFITCRRFFGVAGVILWHRFQMMSCIFPGRRSRLETCIVIRGKRAALQTCRVASFANRVVAGIAFCEM